MTRAPLLREADRATRLCPGPDWAGGDVEEGGDDHLVLIPADPEPSAVLRITRRADVAALLPSRVELLSSLAPQLPWQTPVPLSEIDPGDTDADGDAVVLAFVPGAAHPPHHGDPAALRVILDAVAAVTDQAWQGRVVTPYTSTPRWDAHSRETVLAVLPSGHRNAAESVWATLEQFEEEPVVGLVHGDLAGHNMHWQGDSLVGVIDWDHAAVWDPAINLAHLALWHGLAVIEAAAPDPGFAARASVWVGHHALFRLRRAAETVAAGDPLPRWDRLLRKTLPRLEHAAAAAVRIGH